MAKKLCVMCDFAVFAEEEVWQPLIRPDFLEALWQRLEQLWAQLGFVPPEGASNADAALQQYAQSGQYPAGGLLLCAHG